MAILEQIRARLQNKVSLFIGLILAIFRIQKLKVISIGHTGDRSLNQKPKQKSLGVDRSLVSRQSRRGLKRSFRGLFESFFKNKEIMKIAGYLDVGLVSFLDATTRDEAIGALIELADKEKKISNPTAFRDAILHREQLVSTGIGMGVAVPHAKLSDLDDFFIVIGIQHKKGIEWNALDKAPVRLIFLIGGPDHRQSEYLKILSMLTSIIKDIAIRREMLQLKTPEEVIALFSK